MSIEKVQEFHRKFDLPDGDQEVQKLDPAAAEFRVKFMQEELTEFIPAINDHHTVDAFDALLDLAYVAYGTALMMGISPDQWNRGMEAVHSCNMAKERATSPEQSKRGSTLDVIKPAGWTGPELKLAEILYEWEL